MTTDATQPATSADDPTAPPRRPLSVLADILERAGWTAGQVFCAVLLTTSSPTIGTIELPWRLSLVMSSGAAATSVVTSVLLYAGRVVRLRYWADIGVRLAKTFIAALVGAYAASLADVFAFDWGAALDLAVVTTVTAMAKGLLARQTSSSPDNPANPSTLPPLVYRSAMAR